MALPVFLRPLLLIGHYYRLLTHGFTSWLQRSNEELFGPLEQMIVAVVIITLAMNPELLPQMGAQYQSYPTPAPVLVVYQRLAPALSHAAESAHRPHVASQPIVNSTNNGTEHSHASPNTGPVWLDAILAHIPETWRPSPVTLALIILLISAAIHLLPPHFLTRLRESWIVFWPPWQDRTSPSARSRATSSTSERTSSSSTSAIPAERVSSRSKEATATSSAKDGTKVEASAAAAPRSKTAEEEKARKKASLEYEAKKAAKAKEGLAEEEKKAISIAKGKVADSLDASGKTQSEKARIVKSDTPAIVAVKSRDGLAGSDEKSPDPSDASSQSAPEDDPLMAGDYRPLKSILKKSTKKPRQSKNVHHNYFMTTQGHRAHLVPFPHGLHPPPQEPRHTLWWRNIPKDASHLMAPPPVPKEVKDVLAGEKDDREETKKEKSSERTAADKSKETSGERDNEKEKEKAKAKAEAEAKEKARGKMKEASSREAGTATAKVSIEPPVSPIIPVDPQVQKATWASQAMLCLLLFYIQQQLGLLLLVFFVWQQLNNHAALQEATPTTAPLATATATAKAPSPVATAMPAVKLPKPDDIPPAMKEKLARATTEKERISKQDVLISSSRSTKPPDETKADKGNQRATVESDIEENKITRTSASKGDQKSVRSAKNPDEPVKVDKGKQRAPDESKADGFKTARLGSRLSSMTDKVVPRALSADERAAYRARATIKTGTKNIAPSSRAAPKPDEPETDQAAAKRAKWDQLSDDEKKQYIAERERRRPTGPDAGESKTAEDRKREKWERMSEQEKKQYLAEREKRHAAPDSDNKKTAEVSKREKWDRMSDEEKKRYLAEREKRDKAAKEPDPKAMADAKRQKWERMSDSERERYLDERKQRERARAAGKKAGEGSGLTQEEKEKL